MSRIGNNIIMSLNCLTCCVVTLFVVAVICVVKITIVVVVIVVVVMVVKLPHSFVPTRWHTTVTYSQVP